MKVARWLWKLKVMCFYTSSTLSGAFGVLPPLLEGSCVRFEYFFSDPESNYSRLNTGSPQVDLTFD